MATFLDEHAEESGFVELTDWRVRWWILDESEKRRKTSELPNNGHFGALYQDEPYELVTGRAGATDPSDGATQLRTAGVPATRAFSSRGERT